MSGDPWQKTINWAYKIGLTGIVGLNLGAGLVVITNDWVKPVLVQNGHQPTRTVMALPRP